MGKEDILKRIISLSSRHGYIYGSKQLNPAGVGSCYDYGPLGVELRSNLINEWWTEIVRSREHIVGVQNAILQRMPSIDRQENLHDNVDGSPLFPSLQVRCVEPGEKVEGETCLQRDLHQGTFAHFSNTLSLLHRRLPFGLAQIGPCFRSRPSSDGDSSRFIFSAVERTEMALHFFSTPKTSTLWFDTWQKERLLWWRKFAGVPSGFTATDIKTAGHVQWAEIQFTFPWGVDTIERIANHGSTPVERLQAESKADLQGKDGRKMVIPHLIETTSSLEAGLLALLLDAYQEKSRTDTRGKAVVREILRLHLRLAPLKVVVLPLRGTRELRELCDYLGKEFRKAGINIRCILEMAPSLENYYTMFDEMGVPFTILLNENTVKTGIVRVRNRDTTLMQQLHITEVRGMIQRHLEAD
ncbi:DNA polymerase subunit gamma-2, mitochondrial-like [Diadema setosum]|uniref:DNA polymerase subunit gamma-2, mitochondrial-like n=1 Tax=Diadema setosum TaxID=31175 RepID=UPI003B3BAB94